MYLIEEIDTKECIIRAYPLYDSNGVAIDLDHYVSNKAFVRYNTASLLKPFVVYSEEESRILLEEATDSRKQFFLYYKVGSNSNFDNLEIIPYKVRPEGLNYNDYNIETENDSVTAVRHKGTNMLVRFKTLQLDNEMGLVSFNPIRVFTSAVTAKIQNILHFHVEDMSQSITIDSAFCEPNDSLAQHSHFGSDMQGKPLNYKILFKNHKIWKILYNLGNNQYDEPEFEEEKFNSDSIVQVNKGNWKGYLVKIVSVGVGMLVRAKNALEDVNQGNWSDFKGEEFCSDRHLEELPGMVAVTVIAGADRKLLDEDLNVQLPVCFLGKIDHRESVKYEKLLAQKEKEGKNKAKAEFNKVLGIFIELDNLLKNKGIEQLNKEQTKAKMAELEAFSVDSLPLEELKEEPELSSKLDFIQKVCDQAKMELATHIRVLMFS